MDDIYRVWCEARVGLKANDDDKYESYWNNE